MNSRLSEEIEIQKRQIHEKEQEIIRANDIKIDKIEELREQIVLEYEQYYEEKILFSRRKYESEINMHNKKIQYLESKVEGTVYDTKHKMSFQEEEFEYLQK